MTIAAPSRTLGRYVEPALWVLIALDGGPLGLIALLDTTRSLDGPIGPGTLVAALSRLETLRLVDSDVMPGRGRVYRLTILGRVARGSATILKGRPS
jgi:DNA-binding PadR family transcriptional regulator